MDLRSSWRIHNTVVKQAPHREIGITNLFITVIWEGRIVINRKRPYPPSFNKTLAKIMDPAAGASTWALGSHRWVRYIGILIKSAIVKAILIYTEGCIKLNGIKNIVVLSFWWRNMILAKRGREAVTV